MKFLLPLLRNNLLQLSHANQLRYADTKNRTKTITLYMIFVDVGLLALTSYIQFRAIPAIQNITISDYGTEITIVALGICAYIIVIGIWAAMRGFKNCKNDGTKQ